MKILIIEDEMKVAMFIAKGLRQHNHQVDMAHDGETGLAMLLTTEYDAVILDIMMPKMNGYEVLEAMRAKSLNTPVLMLSARDQLSDRVKGLECGADDYLVKPFAFSELLARVHSITRRHRQLDGNRIRKDNLEIDTLLHAVSRGDQKINLTTKEYELLVTLVNNENRILSRSVLLDRLWGINFDNNSNVIDVTMHRLRGKINLPGEQRLIHTVRGLGYVFKCATEEA